MPSPKFIIVKMEIPVRETPFEKGGEFGFFRYDGCYYAPPYGSRTMIPQLSVFLFDEKVATDLYEAHHCALFRGRRHTLARLWKRKGEGLMTERDQEKMLSTRCEVLGLTTWCELQASTLPAWALRPWDVGFSLKDLPELPWEMVLD